jgi:hypothetical protein
MKKTISDTPTSVGTARISRLRMYWRMSGPEYRGGRRIAAAPSCSR